MNNSILLVEDDPITLIVTKKELEAYGYSIISSPNGEDAVQKIKNDNSIELILMDIDLGSGMDGTEAAQEILTFRNIPIVFLSSHTEREIVEKTEKISSYGYVVKNSGVTVLDASIKMAFKLFSAKRNLENQEKNTMYWLQRSPICTKIIDTDFNLQFMSDAGFDMLGLEKNNELYGQPYPFSFFPNDFKSLMAENLLCSRNSKVTKTIQGYTCDAMGDTVFLNSTIVPVLDDDNRVEYLIVFSIDGTKEKNSYNELEKQREIYRRLFDEHSAVKLLIDLDDGSIVNANKAAERFYGYSKAQLFKMNINDINCLTPAEIKKEMLAAKAGNKNHFDFQHRLANGEVRDVQVFSNRIELSGKDYLHSIIIDVTGGANE